MLKRTNITRVKTVKNNIARCIRTVVKIWGTEAGAVGDMERTHASADVEHDD